MPLPTLQITLYRDGYSLKQIGSLEYPVTKDFAKDEAQLHIAEPFILAYLYGIGVTKEGASLHLLGTNNYFVDVNEPYFIPNVEISPENMEQAINSVETTIEEITSSLDEVGVLVTGIEITANNVIRFRVAMPQIYPLAVSVEP